MTHKHLNLVFQGGGVRGIAHIGALKTIPANIIFGTVAGTSAGAIIAALIAIGKNANQIEEIMKKMELKDFLETEEKERFKRLTDIKDLLNDFLIKKAFFKTFIKCYLQSEKLEEDFKYIDNNLGIYKTNKIKHWLDEIFDQKKFKDIVTEDLIIVATDITEKSFKIYDKTTSNDEYISNAVLDSISIPIFFCPTKYDATNIIVDGGLLSNFPCNLFDKTKYPTVGLTLVNNTDTKKSSKGIKQFIRDLIDTVLDAHDKSEIPRTHFYNHPINTGDIESTDFELTDTQKDYLIKSGEETGQKIKWDEIAETQSILKFIDPRPYDVLSKSLTEMRLVLEEYEKESNWCDALKEEVNIDYIIEDNWDVNLSFEQHLTVEGSKPHFIRRLSFSGTPEGMSLIDLIPEIEPLTGSNLKVNIVPWCSELKRQGFALFLTPPISEQNGCQGFKVVLRIPEDLKNIKQDIEKFTWVFRKYAKKHTLDINITFWEKNNLDKIKLTTKQDWKEEHTKKSKPKYICIGEYTKKIFKITNDFHAEFELEIEP